MPSREQVFRQAIELGQEIGSVQAELQATTNKLNMFDKGNQEAAEKYLLAGEPTKRQNVSALFCVSV